MQAELAPCGDARLPGPFRCRLTKTAMSSSRSTRWPAARSSPVQADGTPPKCRRKVCARIHSMKAVEKPRPDRDEFIIATGPFSCRVTHAAPTVGNAHALAGSPAR